MMMQHQHQLRHATLISAKKVMVMADANQHVTPVLLAIVAYVMGLALHQRRHRVEHLHQRLHLVHHVPRIVLVKIAVMMVVADHVEHAVTDVQALAVMERVQTHVQIHVRDGLLYAMLRAPQILR